jgi:GTPase
MVGGSLSKDFRCGFVCLLGAPNQGKSTIVNALLREGLCATTARPQTTRHAILGLLTTNATQACLIDTPGIIEAPAYRLQEGMMEAVIGAFHDADVLLVVTDLFSTPIPDDELFQRVQASRKPKIVCINKVDLAQRVNATASSESNPDRTVTVEAAVALWRRLVPDAVAILPMSAGEADNGKEAGASSAGRDAGGPDNPGVVALRRILTGGPDVPAAIRDLGRPISGMFPPGVQFVTDEQARALLPKSPPLYDTEALTDRPERFIASETIRAAIFESLKKELPYCCEVRIVKFKEPVDTDAKPMIRIDADVIVERDSQKLIVIGKGGEQIKKIGTTARHKLEAFFQSKVSSTFVPYRMPHVRLADGV